MEQRLRRCESVQTLHFFFLKSSWTVMFVTNSVARHVWYVGAGCQCLRSGTGACCGTLD